MSTYLLDTNVLSYFLNTRRHDELAHCATRVSLAIVEEVRDECPADTPSQHHDPRRHRGYLVFPMMKRAYPSSSTTSISS